MLEELHNRRRLTGLSLGLGFDNDKTGPINHEINKGFCLNSHYDNKPLSIKKTGKELIDKITIRKDVTLAKLAEEIKALNKLLENIDEVPTEEPHTDCYEGIKDKVSYIPLEFSYDQIDAHDLKMEEKGKLNTPTFTSVADIRAGNEEVAPSYNRYNDCPLRKYNRCAREVRDLQVEIGLIDVLSGNLVPQAKYDLGLSQLAELGF